MNMRNGQEVVEEGLAWLDSVLGLIGVSVGGALGFTGLVIFWWWMWKSDLPPKEI